MAEPYLTITSLGGLGEIGLNCQKWETGQGIVLIDCGLMFPDDHLLGVDLVIPRFELLQESKERILGVVLTHGHEDHIGALPWLVTLYKDLRVYGSPFTLALVEHKLAEHALLDKARLIPVHDYAAITLGDLQFHFLPVCHSIPQGFALAVDTPAGKVVHTGDFKLDRNADRHLCEDLRVFAQDGVCLLLSDSTNIEIEGHSRQEPEVRETLRQVFGSSPGRIVVTLFSSHIDRIRTVIDLAREFDRSVLVSGRSLVTNIEKAMALDLLGPCENLHNDFTGLPDLPPEHTVVIATGTQGEPLSALTRIARGEHKQVSLQAGDTVIMSSRVIPGNARAVARVINHMYRLGARVFHDATRTIHATGHACREELQAVLNAVRPEYFIPIHGEYRHLVQHGRLAETCGVSPAKVFVLDNGRPLTLTLRGVRLEEPVPAESVPVDGKGVGDVSNAVLKERRLLGGEGLVVVLLVLAEDTGEVLAGPEIFSRGFIMQEQYSHLLEDAKCLVLDQLENRAGRGLIWLSDNIRSSCRKFFRDVLGRDPVVMPIISQV